MEQKFTFWDLHVFPIIYRTIVKFRFVYTRIQFRLHSDSVSFTLGVRTSFRSVTSGLRRPSPLACAVGHDKSMAGPRRNRSLAGLHPGP